MLGSDRLTLHQAGCCQAEFVTSNRLINVDLSTMSYFNLEALDTATLNHDPFDFLVVPGFLTDTGLEAANRDYPKISTAGNKDLEGLHYGPGFEALLRELTSPDFVQRIATKFAIDLDDAITTITVRKYCEASDGNIHTDHWSKLFTVLLYFNRDWSNTTGQLRMLRSATDIEDYAAEVPPIGGTLLAFRRTRHSWHGHKEFVGERRMLQLNFVKHSRLARYTQQIDRFSTRVIKRLARVVQSTA